MNSSRAAFSCVLLAASLVLSPAGAFGQEEAGFEGWEEGSEKKKEKKPRAPRRKAAARSAAPKVGAGAKAPGSHKGFIPRAVSTYGSLSLKGILQTLFDATFVLDDNDDTEQVAFNFQRARIILQGHLLHKNLEYYFEGDAGNMFSFVLDMYLRYTFGGSGLSLRIGRFLPEFTYMMPRNKADIGAVLLPMYLDNDNLTGGFAVWRQMGLEASYQNDKLALSLGVFNGLMYEPNSINPSLINNQMGVINIGGNTYSNYTDNNKAKDFLLRASFRPSRSLSLDLNFWFGMPESATDPDENDIVIMAGPGVEHNDGKLHLVSELMFRIVDYGVDGVDSVTSLGAWAHAGYRFTDLVEGIFRVDWVEPNFDADNDMRLRITTGPHFWIEEKHFRILVNLYFEMPLQDDPAPTQEEIIALLVQFALAW